jgi:hypothetical protein
MVPRSSRCVNKAGTNFASAWKEAVSRALQIAADRQGIKIGRDLS